MLRALWLRHPAPPGRHIIQPVPISAPVDTDGLEHCAGNGGSQPSAIHHRAHSTGTRVVPSTRIVRQGTPLMI